MLKLTDQRRQGRRHSNAPYGRNVNRQNHKRYGWRRQPDCPGVEAIWAHDLIHYVSITNYGTIPWC
jgi:hypothetical protein